MKTALKLAAILGSVAIVTAAGVSAQDATGNVPPVTLFKNVMVFDGVNDGLKDVDVLVVGNKIHKVEAEIPESGTSEVDASSGAARVIPPVGLEFVIRLQIKRISPS